MQKYRRGESKTYVPAYHVANQPPSQIENVSEVSKRFCWEFRIRFRQESIATAGKKAEKFLGAFSANTVFTAVDSAFITPFPDTLLSKKKVEWSRKACDFAFLPKLI